MMLLIDAGNTRVKIDWIDTHGSSRSGALQAYGVGQLHDIQAWLRALPRAPRLALGVNVAGATTAAAIESLIGCPIEWVSAQHMALGVQNGYREPHQLGADRWAGLLGMAWHERRLTETQPGLGRAALLATFGTATTIDTLIPEASSTLNEGVSIPPDYVFPGGLILPGPAMMLSSLNSGTANLPQAQSETALYPTHTHQAIASGMAAAQAGAVLRQWLAASQLCRGVPRVYVAGGGWPLVRKETCRLLTEAGRRLGMNAAVPIELDAPVLDGLACLAAERLVRI